MADAAFVRVDADLVSRHYSDPPSISLALSDDGMTLAAGALKTEGQSDVRIYRLVDREWQYDRRLTDENPGDQFGAAVALSANGRILAVGAPGNDDNGIDSGHVKVFERDSSGWTLLGTPIVGWAPGDRSGTAVSVNADGSLVLIGAPLNDGKGTDAGNVRIYRFNDTNWQLASPDIDGTLAEDESGFSVSFNNMGNVLAIGSPRHQGVGHTRVFTDEAGTWQLTGEAITGGTSGGRGGHSVSLNGNGDIVAIGEPVVSSNGTGNVRVFRRVADHWQQLGADIESLNVGDRFGWRVRLNDVGNVLVVSAPDSVSEAGLASYFMLVEGNWQPLGGVLSGLAGEELVGQDLAVSGDGTIATIAWQGLDTSGYSITGVSVFALDTDADGIGDYEDAFPLDPAEGLDTDGDGIGNNSDDDDDNDGVVDTIDELPFDPTEVTDADGDGRGDIADPDDDNDGVPDYLDDLPLNSFESVDTDKDGMGNTEDIDDDNDGLLDSEDLLALDAVNPLTSDLLWSYVSALQSPQFYSRKSVRDVSGSSIAMSDDGGVVVVGGARSEARRTIRECVSGNCEFSSQFFTSGVASVFIPDPVSPGSYRRNWAFSIDAEVSISNLSASQQSNRFDSIDDERFGYDVAVSGDGNVAAVGAPGANNGSGLVYIYGLCGSASLKIRLYDQFGGCNFTRSGASDVGSGVALNHSGNRLAVSDSGGVSVWRFDGTGWLELGALSFEDYTSPELAAVTMNAAGDVIAVGEPDYRTFSDLGNQTGAPGRVRVWRFDGIQWVLLGQELTGSGFSSDFSRFGASVSLDETGMKLAVNAPDADLVQIYQFDGSSWLQTGDDIVSQADVIRGVALSGNGSALAIGSSPFDSLGEVVVYDNHQGIWQARPISATGESVALNRLGSLLVLGNSAQAEDNNNDLLFELSVDSDGDGVIDRDDAFPGDDSETADLDGDGIGDNVDDDRDGDGFLNDDDAFPANPLEWLDTDGDFIGNNADEDDDNDGIVDVDDEEPLIPAPPEPAISIGTVLSPQFLMGGGTATYIWARDITARFGLNQVSAEVTSPSGVTFNVDLEVQLIPGRYEIIYDGFVEQGDYQVSIVATDFSGNSSEAALTTVTQREVIPITGADFYEPDNSIVGASLIASDDLGSQQHNLFEAGDVDYVQFFARGGGPEDYYNISITYAGDGTLTGAPNLLLEVLDGDSMAVLDSVNPGMQSGFIGFEPPDDGIYYLRISNLADTMGENTAYKLSVSQQLAGFAGPDVRVQHAFYTSELTTGAGLLLEIQVQNLGGQGSRQTAPSVRLQSSLHGAELTADVSGCDLQPRNLLNCELGDLKRGESRFIQVPLRLNRPGSVRLLSMAVGFDIDGRKMPDDNFSNNVERLRIRVLDSPDSDEDGLPDDFETQIGLDPDDSSDGARDLDGDGRNNLTEYLEGTNPAVDESNLPPFISLIGSSTVELGLGDTFVDAGAIGSDAEDGDLAITVHGLVDTTVAGTYLLVYVAADQQEVSVSVERVVIVLPSPNTAPTITLVGPLELAINQGDVFEEPGVIIKDPEDSDLMPVVTGQLNTDLPAIYVLTYTVTDGGGLSASVNRTVIVRENQPPTINLIGDTVTLTVGDEYIDPGYSGNDAEDGVRPVAVSNIDTSSSGVKTIAYTVMDSMGLTATATRIVVVEDALPPLGTGVPVRLTPDKIIELPVVRQVLSSPTGLAQEVPADATAVSLNVTVVSPDGGGFVTVWPCGVVRPLASNLNYSAGDIVPNGVIAPVGSNGEVCFYSLSTTDLIVDIAGWFVGDVFVGATPQRLVDSRDGTGTEQGKLTAGAPVTMSLVNLPVLTSAGDSTVTPGNLTAAALNITVVNPDAAGFVTVYPCDAERPLASNVNYRTGQTIANGVITPVSAAGEVCVFSLAPTDIVVDLAGWFAGSSFTGALPRRLVDTRDGTGGHSGQLTPVTELTIPVWGNTLTVNGSSRTIPNTASAVSLNVTAVVPAAAGFITVYPCGVTRPEASNLNFDAGDVVANNVIAPIGDNGSICLYTLSATDVVVDISGWFEGEQSNGFVAVTPKRQIDTRFGKGPAPKEVPL